MEKLDCLLDAYIKYDISIDMEVWNVTVSYKYTCDWQEGEFTDEYKMAGTTLHPKEDMIYACKKLVTDIENSKGCKVLLSGILLDYSKGSGRAHTKVKVCGNLKMSDFKNK
jgi:hypothetical protein